MAKLTAVAHGNKARPSDAFVSIINILYRRFCQEDVIDKRILKAFVGDIDNAPKQTIAEQKVVRDMLAVASRVESGAKRIPGTMLEVSE